ncbi:MAG: IS66 family transposase, partial [Halorhodospira sp.]
HCEEGVVEAPRPAQPIPGSRAAPGLLASIIVAKYLDAMPLYRQERFYAREGVPMLDRSVLSHWTVRAGELLDLFVDRLHACLLGAGVVHADETPLQVLKEPGRKARQKSTMWVYGTGGREPPVLIYCYQPTRGSEHPIEFLDGFAGYLQRDGFSGYRRLERLRPQIQGVGCMAHARRKFVDVLKGQPSGGGDSFAEEVVERIGELYGIEREIAALDDAERYRQRQERAVPRLEALRARLDEQVAGVPPKSLLGKAIAYALNEWPYLVRYVEDGRLDIDNSYIERAIKPFVIGRKNFLFSNTPRGARASANHYTVIETARANGLEPHAYLEHLFRVLPTIDRDNPVGLDDLLPWNVTLES